MDMNEPPTSNLNLNSFQNVNNIQYPFLQGQPIFNNVHLYYQNCQDLNSKLDSLLGNLCSYPQQLNVICLSETWLSSATHSNSGFPPNFHVVRADRDPIKTGLSTGGGVLIALDSKFKYRRRTDLEFQGCGEICFVEIFLNSSSLIIGNHYFRPKTDVSSFSLFCDFIKEKLLHIDNLILVGDFNLPGVNWETLDTSHCSNYYVQSRANFFTEAVSFLNVAQVNRQTLNIDDNLLDLILTNVHEFDYVPCANVPSLCNLYRGHPPLLYSFHFLSRFAIPPDIKTYNFSKGNYLNLYTSLQQRDWSDVLDEPNIHVATEHLTSAIQDSINSNIPTRSSKRFKSKYPGWFSRETISLLKHKERVHRKYKRSHCNEHYQEFSLLRARSKKSICRDKFLKNKKIQDSFLTASRDFWGHVAKVTKPRSGIDVLVQNGVTLKDDKSLASCFGTYFSSVYKDPTLLPQVNPTNVKLQGSSDFLPLPIVSSADVLAAVKTLKPSLSVGPDGIPTFIIKGCAIILAPILSSLFNRSLKAGIFPTTGRFLCYPCCQKSSKKLSTLVCTILLKNTSHLSSMDFAAKHQHVQISWIFSATRLLSLSADSKLMPFILMWLKLLMSCIIAFC